jgi:orotate phosphoribosyltransferase
VSGERERLKEILCTQSILYGDFTLVSGLKSTYYIDGKMTSFDGEGAYLIGQLMLDEINNLPHPIDSVGGPTMGADPLVTGIGIAAFLRKQPLRIFVVRQKLKDHGTQKLIEGNFKKGDHVVIVEDVITTGGSIFNAITAVEEAGGIVEGVMVVVDRLQGGAQLLNEEGYRFKSLFTINELLKK